MDPGCTHYLRSLGSSNELRGSPPLSQCDLRYVSVPLMKSSPYFPLGISVSLRGCFELFDAEGGQYLTSVARWLLWIWSFARLLHHRILTGYPLDMWCQSTSTACIHSFKLCVQLCGRMYQCLVVSPCAGKAGMAKDQYLLPLLWKGPTAWQAWWNHLIQGKSWGWMHWSKMLVPLLLALKRYA